MSFTVKFYNFSKRFNSTKVPASDAGTEYNCIIKNGSSIINPKIELNLGLINDPSTRNYAYIPSFDRYYYVREWEFKDALWIVTLEVDVLATYKTEIGNANLYVLRASAENDGRIIDTLYPAKTTCKYNVETISNPWGNSVTDGCFVVGVMSRTGDYGSLSYYGLTYGTMRQFTSRLYDSTVTTDNGFDFTEMTRSLQLSLVNPSQYIKSAVYIPVDFDSLGTRFEEIYLFDWDLLMTGKTISSPKKTISHTLNIPKHPQTNSRGNYVNAKPFTRAQLFFPPFGVFDLDTDVTCSASSLTVRINIDVTSGFGNIEVRCNNQILTKTNSMIGVPIQISQVTRDYIGGITSSISGVASAMTGNYVGALGGIGNAAQSLAPRSNSIGSNGSFGQLYENARLEFQFYEIADDDNAQNGRPLCKKRVVKNLGGYMLIQDGDVATNGTLQENRQIQSLLEGGFYYE